MFKPDLTIKECSFHGWIGKQQSCPDCKQEYKRYDWYREGAALLFSAIYLFKAKTNRPSQDYAKAITECSIFLADSLVNGLTDVAKKTS